MNEVIIQIGNADMGGYWFAVGDTDFQDGFPTAWAAAEAAMSKYRRYSIYYREFDNRSNRWVSIPGETTENR